MTDTSMIERVARAILLAGLVLVGGLGSLVNAQPFSGLRQADPIHVFFDDTLFGVATPIALGPAEERELTSKILSNNGRDEAEPAKSEDAKRPYSHILLGVQIVFGALTLSVGLYGCYRASDSLEDRGFGAAKILLVSSCAGLGCIVTLLSVFQLIDPYFPPAIPS